MFRNLGINWACTLIAFLSLACAPLPLYVLLSKVYFSECADLTISSLFSTWGQRIRRSSKFAREADDAGREMREKDVSETRGGL